ncbi:hypothetical protein [Kroppenstedtia pulmonis]|uniref:hypothetical protein n=1 Tax=Kroppenstedtia pulmonis TaxID=1380685 RepID=UPI001567C170|nr:hypothetical protein [Kroppenstedtia pulmonis]
MKKRSLMFLAKGVGYSTAVFFHHSDLGRSVSKIGHVSGLISLDWNDDHRG